DLQRRVVSVLRKRIVSADLGVRRVGKLRPVRYRNAGTVVARLLGRAGGERIAAVASVVHQLPQRTTEARCRRRVPETRVAGDGVVTVADGDAVVARTSGDDRLGVGQHVALLVGREHRLVAGHDDVVAGTAVDPRVADAGLDDVGLVSTEDDRVA